MKQALSILIGYLTCEDPTVKTKWANLLASFWHKDEGKIVTGITTATNGDVTIEIKDGDGNSERATIPKVQLPTSHDISFINGLQDALNDKVDKVTGKGLSTNDFTTAFKQKLEGLQNYVHPPTHSIAEVDGLHEALDGIPTKTSSLQNDGENGTDPFITAKEQLLIKDADGDTKIEVEKTADEDIIHVTVKGKEVMRILTDGTIEMYDTLIRHTTPNRVYNEEGWFVAAKHLLGAFFKDAANEFWTYALHYNQGAKGTDRTAFYHELVVRRRTVAAAGRLNNPNEEKTDGYALQIEYFPKDGEGSNYGLPDYLHAKLGASNSYFVVGSWGPGDYEAGEKQAVHGGAFVKDTLRVGRIKLTNPTASMSTINSKPSLVYNEANDMIELARNTPLATLMLSNVFGSSVQYRIKDGRLIIIGSFSPLSSGANVLLATLPTYFRPNRDRHSTFRSIISNETRALTIKTNGELRASVLVSSHTYLIDTEITLIL